MTRRGEFEEMAGQTGHAPSSEDQASTSLAARSCCSKSQVISGSRARPGTAINTASHTSLRSVRASFQEILIRVACAQTVPGLTATERKQARTGTSYPRDCSAHRDGGWPRVDGLGLAHNPKIAGSNPAPATSKDRGQPRLGWPLRRIYGFSAFPMRLMTPPMVADSRSQKRLNSSASR